MQAGKLRHLLILQQSTDVTNSRGEAIPTWSDVASVWGEVTPLSGREGLAAQQVYATASHRVRIRYRPGVVPKMRFLKGSREFDIDAVLNVDERNRELTCLVTERNL